MNKALLFSLAAAMVLFTACGEETKKAADETAKAAEKTVETAAKESKELVKKTIEKAKETVETVKEKAKPVVKKAAEKVEERAKTVKEAVKETVSPAEKPSEKSETPTEEENTTASQPQEVSDTEAGETLYVKCSSCHGNDGKTKALGKSAPISGQSAGDIETKLTEYRAGTRNTVGMGMLMKGQAASLSDTDIKALAAYIATLK